MAAGLYEARVRSAAYQFHEANADHLQGLKEVYRAIHAAKNGGSAKGFREEDRKDYENAYTFAVELSSLNKAEMDAYTRGPLQSMVTAAGQLIREDKKNMGGAWSQNQRDLEDYMIAKHGLERNELMSRRAADAAFAQYQAQNPKGHKTWDDFYKYEDYAGLTSVTAEADPADAKMEAERMVRDYESRHNPKGIDELWARVHDCTDSTLVKLWESGVISRDQYNEISSMYKNYIPLKGWDEVTTEDEYAYLNEGGRRGGSVLRKAEGRKSRADSPLAMIAMDAERGINEGNRNRMKQKFLNFAMNNPSDLVSVSKLWLEHDPVTDEWSAKTCDTLKADDTPAQVQQKMEAWEKQMEAAAKADPDRFVQASEKANIPYKIKPGTLSEHQVLVKRLGKTVVLTINGSPRAAQALNGLTNPDVLTGAWGSILNGAMSLNRKIAQFVTSRSPNFVASNFFRDVAYSTVGTWVREDPKYASRMMVNLARCNPASMKKLFHKFNHGTLDQNNELERLFGEFMRNGGETGYTSMNDIDRHKRRFIREVKEGGKRWSVKRAWSWLGDCYDLVNRSVENSCRFSAYVTSRQSGRDIQRSVWDGKEVSVNFNRKGAGDKFRGAQGQTLVGNVTASVDGVLRPLTLFWNAGMQGTYNYCRLMRRHPAKGALMTAASMMVLGFASRWLNQMLQNIFGGDDDDKEGRMGYDDIPENVRRSNICVMIPGVDNLTVTVPLPIEFRAWYGLGELACGLASGADKRPAGDIAYDAFGQISQILPVDLLEGGQELTWGQRVANVLTPPVAQPFVEAYGYNRDWTGMPIYNDGEWSKNMPEWTKAYARTSPWLVELSQNLSEVTGGDRYKGGWVDLNPARIQHIAEGLFGGFVSVPRQLCGAYDDIATGEGLSPRDVPIVSRVLRHDEAERGADRKLNADYWRLAKENETKGDYINRWLRDSANPENAEAREKMREMWDSGEMDKYIDTREYLDIIREYTKAMREIGDKNDPEYKRLAKEQREVKKKMVNEIIYKD